MTRPRCAPPHHPLLLACGLGVSVMLAGCEQIIVLGSECPRSTGSCVDETAPTAEPDGEVELQDAQVTEPSGDDAGTQACGAATGVPCGCDAGNTSPLLAYWRLDERTGRSASEATGHVANGALQNFADAGPWVSGKVGGALQLDGVDDQVQLNAVAGEVRTLALWLKPTNPQVISGLTPAQLPSSHGPLDQWSDPQFAYKSDRSWSTVASLIGTRAQHWGGFHLMEQLPKDAQILGITVTVETGNLGLLGAMGVELSWDGGSTHTDARYGWGQLIAGSNLRQAGGPDRLWGRSWSADDFADDKFRVRATFGGIANTMALDYLSVEIRYAEYTTGRDILGLSTDTALTFASSGKELITRGWPGSEIYVNGILAGAVVNDWNEIVITSATPLNANKISLARAPNGYLGFSYQGLIDDVRMFDTALTPEQLSTLQAPVTCDR